MISFHVLYMLAREPCVVSIACSGWTKGMRRCGIPRTADSLSTTNVDVNPKLVGTPSKKDHM